MIELLAFIGIDDTDSRKAKARGSGRGTGRVAREAARELMITGFKVLWVLRHQMINRELVNTPGNNSSKSVTIEVGDYLEATQALDIVESVVKDLASPDSNAGVALCVTTPPPPKALRLAEEIRERLVGIDEVEEVADECGIELRALAGDGSGVIGAFAASVLAATGNDGRVLDIPSTGIRGFRNSVLSVADILRLGVAEVRSIDGYVLRVEELVRTEEFKPVLRGFKPVLYVRRVGGEWVAVKVE